MARKIVMGMVFLALLSPVFADIPDYTVYRTTGKVVLDGILDEEDWAVAPSVGSFVFPWWTSGDKEQTEVKLLWNDTYLYIAIIVQDTYIWADHNDTNSWTYLDDAVEFFWNPNPEAGNIYYFFEMNCAGNLLCVYDYYGNDFLKNKAMVPRIATNVSGTVNKDSDRDTGWTLEIAIRFSDYTELSKRTAPLPGDTWRVNLNRCGGKTNPQYSQWSPSQTENPNFHRPEDFGRLFFSGNPVNQPTQVEEGELPGAIAIRGNHPNPFNPSTTIEYFLPEDGYVELVVYTSASQKIRELVASYKPAGSHLALWDGRDGDGKAVSSGVYFTHLRMGEKTATGRMLLMK